MSNCVQVKQTKVAPFFLWITLAFAFCVVGWFTVYRAAISPAERTDFTVFLAAGFKAVAFDNIYDAVNGRGWNYVYPPPFALLLIGLTWVPKLFGAIIWYLLEVISIVFSTMMTYDLIKRFFGRVGVQYWLLPLLSMAVIIVGSTMRAQASVFMMPLVIGVFYFYFIEKNMVAELCLAGAILLKVFPVALVIYFVIRRQWWFIIGTLVFIVFLGFVILSIYWGNDLTIIYYKDWLHLVASPVLHDNQSRHNTSALFGQLLDTSKPRNQSLEALALSYYFSPLYAKLFSMVVGLLLLICLWKAVFLVKNKKEELYLASAFLVWSFIISPIAENHYFCALILPVSMLTVNLLSEVDLPYRTKFKNKAYQLVFGVFCASVMLDLPVLAYYLRPLCLVSVFLIYLLVRNIFKKMPIVDVKYNTFGVDKALTLPSNFALTVIEKP